MPLTMITVDIATLIGLLANPAYLAGHGSIDPDLARELARNSQWQILLTEAVTLAEKLGLAVQNPETGEWERRSGGEKAGTATGSDAGSAAGTVTDEDTDTQADTDVNADADSADAADDVEGGSATDSEAKAGPSTSPTSASAPASERAPENTPAPETPADEMGETGGPEENEKTGEVDETAGSEEDDESTPVPATDPSATPETDAAEPVRKNAATRAGTPVTDPQADAPSSTDPEAATPSETAPASGLSPEQASQAPDIASDCAQSRSSATPSGPAASGQRPAGLAPQTGPAPPTGPASGTDPVPAAAAASDDRHPHRPGSLASAAALFCTHTPVGKGTRHSSALVLPTASRRNNPASHTTGHTPAARTPSGIYLGNASLAAALEAAIAADPTLGKTVARDPLTDRALIYRPDALTTAAVRLRDRHCRFPGCQRPADRCQLDHITPFDHANPLGGGWTTVNNLQCLCEFHHTVKTAGYWSAVMLPGGAILWRSTSKTTRITLPANGTAVPILDNDLRPHIPTKPRRSGIIAYRQQPDNHEQESEPTIEDTEDPPF
ncbi:hypothetical protein ASG84_14390 [Rhodococcus sp. Leaf278]|nr:hypothetical protein ASG84_14390 [Rhodococcus sp. Leaf278]